MHELDHVRWCVNRSWSRLGRGESNVLAAAGVDLSYDDVVSSLRHRADALCRFAWVLEATASRVEVADERAAGDFNFTYSLQGLSGLHLRLTDPDAVH
jgi:hypothetical protein